MKEFPARPRYQGPHRQDSLPCVLRGTFWRPLLSQERFSRKRRIIGGARRVMWKMGNASAGQVCLVVWFRVPQELLNKEIVSRRTSTSAMWHLIDKMNDML